MVRCISYLCHGVFAASFVFRDPQGLSGSHVGFSWHAKWKQPRVLPEQARRVISPERRAQSALVLLVPLLWGSQLGAVSLALAISSCFQALTQVSPLTLLCAAGFPRVGLGTRQPRVRLILLLSIPSLAFEEEQRCAFLSHASCRSFGIRILLFLLTLALLPPRRPISYPRRTIPHKISPFLILVTAF
jgi:hypothetical protein